MTIDGVAPAAVDTLGLAAQYETLRGAALGEPLPPEARQGLALLLRRGMWAWTQAGATMMRPPSSPTSTPAAGVSGPAQPDGVIHVLAAMALSSHHRSAR